MQAYSIPVIAVLALVYLLYWLKPLAKFRTQNILLLTASYACYAIYDLRFLALILFIALTNFFIGNRVAATSEKSKQKSLLVLNIVLNGVILGFFRYYNYLAGSITKLASLTGSSFSLSSLDILVPLGISIYVLQAISYSFDIYKKKVEPTTDIISFLAFVSFFPQMLAGPIERASTILPQLLAERERKREDFTLGAKRILWGLFKKLVIANNVAVYANEIFTNYNDYTGFTIFAGLVCFAFQFYTDLSGLSDIAIGVSRLFGIRLNTNFRFPYFSKNLNDFWSRWNISLMFWIKDYVYKPLGGSERRMIVVFRNLFLVYLLVGLWHGGNWSFILFGLLNALILLPSTLRPEIVLGNYNNKIKFFDGVEAFVYFLFTGFIVVVGLTFFRAGSWNESIAIIRNLFTHPFSFTLNELRSLGNGLTASVTSVIMVVLYTIIEWFMRKSEFALDFTDSKISVNQGKFITALVLILLCFFYQSAPNIVYFRY
jgi:alginate O-acetyltransferase complex protein AlgI